eukprot:contig_16524_g4009
MVWLYQPQPHVLPCTLSPKCSYFPPFEGVVGWSPESERELRWCTFLFVRNRCNIFLIPFRDTCHHCRLHRLWHREVRRVAA